MEQAIQQFKRHSGSPALRAAFPATLPVLTGYICLGMAFGILLQTSGYGVVWALGMSVICFAGSGQFLAVTLLTSAFDPLQAFVLSVMINARHIFYGLSLLEKYKGLGKVRAFLIFGMTDETFSLVSSMEPPEGTDRQGYYFWITCLDYIYWITGSVLGNLVGNVIPFSTAGIEFVLTALFVVLFLEQWKKKENRAAGVAGLVCAAVSLAVFGADNLVIPAMVVLLAVLLGGRKYLCI